MAQRATHHGVARAKGCHAGDRHPQAQQLHVPEPNQESAGELDNIRRTLYILDFIDDVRRLTFIKRCRDFGFPIEQVKHLVELFENGDRACQEVRDLAQVHLDQVRAKLEEMRQLEASLATFVDSCNSTCSGGATRDCTIIDDLSAVGAHAGTMGCCQPPARTPRKVTTKAGRP